MAKLIQKVSYTKAAKAKGYMEYIATRTGVELIDPDREPTANQKKLISQILEDHPDAEKLFEYEDYQVNPNRRTASGFIGTALDRYENVIDDRSIYMKYIAERPRAERRGNHGLFGSEKNVDLEKTMEDLSKHKGNVWTIIYSLRREDASRLGYDNAERWRKLLLNHEIEMAEKLNVRPDQLRWYAAFHDEGHHPHIHMMLWAEGATAHLSQEDVVALRSAMTNEIFQDELYSLYQQKDIAYQELMEQAHEYLADLSGQIVDAEVDDELKQQFCTLAAHLQNATGKKVYGYLPKRLKAEVNEIVDALEQVPEVKKAYEVWNQVRDEQERYYKDKEREHAMLRDQKEFRAIKNKIVQAALGMAMEETVTAAESETEQETPQTQIVFNANSVAGEIDNLLYNLSQVFQKQNQELYQAMDNGKVKLKMSARYYERLSKFVVAEQTDHSDYLGMQMM